MKFIRHVMLNCCTLHTQASSTSLHSVESVKATVKTSETKNVSKSQDLSTDFQEDPFKNYRYEDPFMIEDPFKDENGNEKAEKGKKSFKLN